MEGALFFVNVVSAGIFVGVQLLVLESVAPVIRRQERALSIQLHRELLDHKRHVRIAMPNRRRDRAHALRAASEEEAWR